MQSPFVSLRNGNLFLFAASATLAGTLLAPVAVSQDAPAEVEVIAEIVAKVNGDIITNVDLKQDRKFAEQQLRDQGVLGADLQRRIDELASDMLRERIDQLLLQQKGQEMGYEVDSDVNRQIADYQRQYEIPDPLDFQEYVEKETGQPFADFRDQLTNNMLVQAVVSDEIMRRITFTRDEMMAYYNEHLADFNRKERVFLREILVDTRGKKGEELEAAKKKAEDLSSRGKRGEAFAQMAMDNSDAQTKESGGYLQPFEKGVLSEQLESLVWDQPRGFVTDPIEVPAGFLILKVDDHQQEGLASFDEVQNEVQDILFQQRREPAVRAYLTKRRSESFLQIKEGYADSGAAPGQDTGWGEVAYLQPETVVRSEVLANPGRKRLFGMFPVPGTVRSGESSSR